MGGSHRTTERSRSGAPGRVLRWVVALAMLGAVGLAVAVALVPAVAGGTALTVLSPSMRGTLAPGDVVVIRPRPVEGIAAGDVITFLARDPMSSSTRVVTHRVVEVQPGPSFRTRGDANQDADPGVVAAADVRGVMWYRVPWVGGVAVKLMTPAGAVTGAGAVVLVLGVVLLLGARNRRGGA
ncbi:signal peptidase I [Pseudonocardia humida]|uniref:Signal peptidase I n=1 Tax=Pseudonocardia humida TaxID=2800819 RepID=A0ABT1ADV5_9PSEU|nr:signal peptidase I [Pseudonocardia humida]MCO1661151.1 signal peptidase I [Pseudonocardia humida]